jgi:putative Mg2+ transporter-C (MgtC) family protein
MLVTKSADGFTDPIRMAGQIVVGVGFIGGGLLFRDGTQTQGINTAATLWCCAAVGTLCGLNRASEAVAASVIIVLANTVLRQAAQFLNLKMGVTDNLTSQIRFDLSCQNTDASKVRKEVEEIFSHFGFEIKGISQKTLNTETAISIKILIENGNINKQTELILKKMSLLKLTETSWSQI